MYAFYDIASYLITPMRRFVQSLRTSLRSNPDMLEFGALRFVEGLADMYERSTRNITKPEFNIGQVTADGEEINVYQTTVMKKPFCDIGQVTADGEEINVYQTTVMKKPFCDLVHFTKENQRKEPKVLIIAPVSGHFATLLRDTVKRMAQKHDVYITDWKSARDVPMSAGDFRLDEYLSYLIDFMHHIGPNTHVMAVCQPAVQVMALAAIMDESNDPCTPASIIPMGGPIDPRVHKTQVNKLAEDYPLKWFEKNFLTFVPEGYAGVGRRVYPGFIQLTSFINMNPDSHYRAHIQFLEDKILNNQAGIDKHTAFYDEYLSVLDMDDVYYLETVEKIFQTHELPRGVMKYRGHRVDLKAIRHSALLTIEGENDDISAPGQSFAAHDLCPNLPNGMHGHHLQPKVGHYGVFSGSKWRSQVAPKIEEFIGKFDKEMGTYRRV